MPSLSGIAMWTDGIEEPRRQSCIVVVLEDRYRFVKAHHPALRLEHAVTEADVAEGDKKAAVIKQRLQDGWHEKGSLLTFR